MSDANATCFIAMPITTQAADAALYTDDDHWIHVMEHLFIPAIEAFGYKPIPPTSRGSSMIHADIVKNLERCDMVLCDFSGLNANVFFELGVRVSLDKPMALVRDEHTAIPFDLGGVNTHTYASGLKPWDIKQEISKLTDHLKEAELSCDGSNPLWKQFGLTMRAQESNPSESPTDAAMVLLQEQVDLLRDEVKRPSLAHATGASGRRISTRDVAQLVMTFAEASNIHLAAFPSKDPKDRNIAIAATPEVFADGSVMDKVLRQWSKDFNVTFELMTS